MARIAAIMCPEDTCPSDAADWAPLMGMHPEWPTKVLLGGLHRCKVCDLKWVELRDGGQWIPAADYWAGDEWG